ncbi:chorismate mutase [Candidatus Woesearchaeota archaeon]|nr:chorismate mutase [Candidatus Woesearchaeota archaeon]
MNLDELRKEIIKLDMSLLELLKKRKKIVEKIADYKIENKLPVRDESRERKLFDLITDKCHELNLDEKHVKRLYEEIIKESCRLQNRLLNEKK